MCSQRKYIILDFFPLKRCGELLGYIGICDSISRIFEINLVAKWPIRDEPQLAKISVPSVAK